MGRSAERGNPVVELHNRDHFVTSRGLLGPGGVPRVWYYYMVRLSEEAGCFRPYRIRRPPVAIALLGEPPTFRRGVFGRTRDPAVSALLEVSGIAKSFPGVQALKGVQFELNSGEVLAIVGEHGAGKSCLMKILSGIYTRDAGTSILDGKEVHIDNPRAAQRLGVSIVHQEMNLMPDLTIAQNIYCLLYTSPSPRDGLLPRMPSSA